MSLKTNKNGLDLMTHYQKTLQESVQKLRMIRAYDAQRLSESGYSYLNDALDDIHRVSSSLSMNIMLHAPVEHLIHEEDDFENLCADIAINITDFLVNAKYIKDCTDTDDMTEFNVQDGVRTILHKQLDKI